MCFLISKKDHLIQMHFHTPTTNSIWNNILLCFSSHIRDMSIYGTWTLCLYWLVQSSRHGLCRLYHFLSCFKLVAWCSFMLKWCWNSIKRHRLLLPNFSIWLAENANEREFSDMFSYSIFVFPHFSEHQKCKFQLKESLESSHRWILWENFFYLFSSLH